MRPEYAYLETISLGNSFNALIERRFPLVTNDLAKEPNAALEGWRDFQQRGICALVVMPLSARDQVIGALTAAHSHPHVWSQSEIDLLQTIANQVANAVDNAQLFQNVLAEQRKIQAIFDSGLSGLYATDAQSRIVMFNRVAERVTGWTLGEVQGKSWQQIFDNPAPLIQTALERKESVYDSEGRELKARDGHLIPVAEAVAPLFDEKGEVSGAVGAFWDLTQEMEAKQSYERFLTMVAHQLRSPLSAVLSALQLLERQNLSTARRTVLWGVIRSDGARLKKFANEFLELEASVKSPRPLQLEPFSIVTLARRLTHNFKSAKHRHHFRVTSSKPDPIVYADTWRVENVLRNLMDNAVNYSPANSLITINIQVLSADWVDIAVHDQGDGIPSEDRERIFEPFYRSSKIGGQPTEGHGLGLVIARTMVNEMGGKIWLDEQPSHGATFHFTLRRYQ
jgi:PAS domain S-box-containing protein